MAHHYTLKNFLRLASNELLAEYFQTRGIDLGINPKTLRHRNVEPLAEAVDRLSEDQQAEINLDFQKVEVMASGPGLRQIVEEARFQAIDLAAELALQKSLLNRVFWTYLRFPSVFDLAAQFAVPLLAGRYWKRGLPVRGTIGDPKERVKALEEAVSGYFHREEGRGKACKVDYRGRGAIHQFHAYPEDYPAAPLAWSKIGLEPHPYRPAFEVVFVFHEDEGSLDIYFEGGKPTVERLWQVFGATALGIDDLQKPDKPSYALEGLKSRHFAFVRPPDSPIVDVRVKRLGFAMLGYPSTKVTVETDIARDPHAIHDMIGRTFTRDDAPSGHFALSQAKVISAGLRATIDRRDGKAPLIRSFDLSERTCSLKHEGPDLLLRRMLVDSGIDRTGRPVDAVNGTPRQVA